MLLFNTYISITCHIYKEQYNLMKLESAELSYFNYIFRTEFRWLDKSIAGKLSSKIQELDL